RGAENACLACSRDSQSTTLPSRSRVDSSEIADMCELDMKSAVCCTKSKGEGRKLRRDAHTAGRACQRRLGDVRACAGPQRTNSAFRPAERHSSHAGTCQNSASHNKKETTGKYRHSPTKQLPTSTVVRSPGRREQQSRREGTGGALGYRPHIVVRVVLRLGFRHAFVHSVAMLWCCAWCASTSRVVTEEEVALEGRSSRKDHDPRQVGICEQRVLASCMLV
ncbi:hypothetical protein B0H11DRAFT_2400460, partial [Mycena galericulata]